MVICSSPSLKFLETATGRVVLHPQVDGAKDAIFELQDRLVAEITGGLRQKLPSPGGRAEETQSLAAYEAFSKGLLNLQAETQEALEAYERKVLVAALQEQMRAIQEAQAASDPASWPKGPLH